MEKFKPRFNNAWDYVRFIMEEDDNNPNPEEELEPFLYYYEDIDVDDFLLCRDELGEFFAGLVVGLNDDTDEIEVLLIPTPEDTHPQDFDSRITTIDAESVYGILDIKESTNNKENH